MAVPFELSKSTFMYGNQCEKRLYLHKKFKHLANPLDIKQEALFASGTDAGILARGLFPNGKDASPPDAFQYALAAKNTEVYLSTHFVIYEATFIANGVMCAVDILVRKGNKWYAFEVKNTNSIKPQHIMDAALQYWVITQSGLPLADFSIVHLNKSYVRKGEIDIQQLFTMDSVLDEVLGQQAFISSKINQYKALLVSAEIPDIAVGNQCQKPYPCNFTDYCFKDVLVEEEPIHDLTIQVEEAPLAKFKQQIKYPLYYLDFETMMFAVPPFDDTSPWQQLPFQYSLHIQYTRSGELEHKHFLGDGKTDPRSDLLLQLINDIGQVGSILVYYSPFEIGRLKELASLFPMYQEAINQLLSRMIDLIIPFKKGWITIPSTRGSNSIKDVLPALVPNLSYANLSIQEGSMASLVYTQLQSINENEQELQRANLLAYCHLDTLAMVKIWEWIELNVPTK